MKPILIIAPFEDMYYSTKNLIHKYDFVDVELATLDDAVKIVKEKKGVDVIISRGGTLERIRECFPDTSTVEIKVSPYDMLHAINKAKIYGRNICVIGFKNIIDGIENLGAILDVELSTYLVSNKYEAEKAFLDAKARHKIDVILGGSLSESMAKEYGINTVFLRTSESSIEMSILEAKNILEIKRREKEKTERSEAILNNIKEGIISTDKNGVVIIYNQSAENIIGISKSDVLGKDISKALKNKNVTKLFLDTKPEYGRIEHLSNKSLLMNKVPIMIKDEIFGVVATFEDITKIQEYEEIIRSNLLKKGHIAKYNFDDIIGNSEEIIKTKDKAVKYAANDSNILIVGDTGTGKEIFAQSIHNNSLRKNGPFVAINCASISSSLMESELFGYSGGSFTGANKDGKNGLFVFAHSGTLLLDEISETTIELQSKLLRVLQEREVRPIGSDRVIPVDVRIISATNKSLLEEVKNGRFRRDLYYRLNVLSLNIPSLLKRYDDIESLCNYFINNQKMHSGQTIKLSNKAIIKLQEYHWPGNIRELENVIQRLCILLNGKTIDDKDIINVLDEYIELESNDNPIKVIEQDYINRTILECNGNKTQAAKKLGISRTQLWRKLNN